MQYKKSDFVDRNRGYIGYNCPRKGIEKGIDPKCT